MLSVEIKQEISFSSLILHKLLGMYIYVIWLQKLVMEYAIKSRNWLDCVKFSLHDLQHIQQLKSVTRKLIALFQ